MQNKKGYSLIGLVGGLFTHQTFFVGMYSWLFDRGWNYPLYSSGFLICKLHRLTIDRWIIYSFTGLHYKKTHCLQKPKLTSLLFKFETELHFEYSKCRLLNVHGFFFISR